MDFVIPLNKDDLLQDRSGRYCVQAMTSLNCINQALNEVKKGFERKGPESIFDHFDHYFSVILHGKKVEISIAFRTYDRILKSVNALISEFENNISDTLRQRNLNMTKMHAYILSNLMCQLEERTYDISNDMDKKKKNAKKSEFREEWEQRREAGLVAIHRWLQLNIPKLWLPSIVEEPFIALLSDICYKIIEHDKDARERNTKQTIWQILGTLVTRYIHGMTCKIKIVQLMKMYDGLGPALASGVIIMITENDCPSFLMEILQEIDQGNLEESEARNVASFIETIASSRPKLMLPNLHYIMEYLNNECYIMRNCAFDVMGNVIIGCLNGDDLSNKDKALRKECFERLLNHQLDMSTYVRSKVFQTWQKLAPEYTIPGTTYGPLLKAITPHLEEKSPVIRKQALQCIRVLIQFNPFESTLDLSTFVKLRDEAEKKLIELQANVVAESGSQDDERVELWRELQPRIQAELREYFENNEDEEEDDNEFLENLENEDPEGDGEEFETVRQLLIARKIPAAIKCFGRICSRLKDQIDLSNIESTDKQDIYFILLLKLFLESEKGEMTDKEKVNSAEWKKCKNDIAKLRHIYNSLNVAVVFIEEFEKAIPTIEEMLYSAAPAVAIEACTLLGTAYQFKVEGAKSAIHTALSQIFSREESVRNNVALVYKEIYLKYDNLSDKQKAIVLTVNGLINLLKVLKPGQSDALASMITHWFSNGHLNDETVRVMWEKYTMKAKDSTINESRCAVALLAMVAQNRPKLITTNLSVLITVGLKEKGSENLLLARDTCRALLKIKLENEDPLNEYTKFHNDHELFGELSKLLIESFETAEKMIFVSFATDAINVIYHLADQPDEIIKQIIGEMLSEQTEVDMPVTQLAKLVYFIGHVTIRHMVYLDVDVYKNLKRRNLVQEAAKKKKNNDNRRNQSIMSNASSTSDFPSARKARKSMHRRNMSIQDDSEKTETLAGAVAEDVEGEAIDEALENTVVNGDGFLAQFVPLILEVCQHPEKYKDLNTQVWAVTALTKMMTVSSEFCKQNLQLLITILERSEHPVIKSNILVGLSDMMIRFPNEVEPWTAHMYKRLRDEDVSVRRTALRVLSTLVKREMIRIKGQMSEVALCIVDNDKEIRSDAKSFFYELSQKGHVLYNILPDILSRLTSSEAMVDEEDLQKILAYIIGLLHKEKETDSLLDKICTRFSLATSERQWCDLAYCLTLLPLGKKGITRLTTNLPLLKDKLHNRQVYNCFKEIIAAARKNADAVEACTALEKEIDRLMSVDEASGDQKATENEEGNDETKNEESVREDSHDSDTEVMPPPSAPPKRLAQAKKRKLRRRF